MLRKEYGRILNRHILIIFGALLLGVALAPQIASAETLNELISRAKQEGALNAAVVSGLGGKTTQQLAASFRKRFGLQIEVTLVPLLNTEEIPKAVAETKAGLVPTYDVHEGADTQSMALEGIGGVHKVDNWDRLLSEINPLVRSGGHL